jgi:hypothetical protein
MIECKASKTVQPAMAAPITSLRRSMGHRATARLAVVHRTSAGAPPSRALAPGVEALDVRQFVDALAGRRHRAPKTAPARALQTRTRPLA